MSHGAAWMISISHSGFLLFKLIYSDTDKFHPSIPETAAHIPACGSAPLFHAIDSSGAGPRRIDGNLHKRFEILGFLCIAV
jgi:carbon starvation protein CstA